MEESLESLYYQQLETASKVVPPEKLMRLNWINLMIERIESAKKIIENDSYDNLHPKVKETLKNYYVAEVLKPGHANVLEKKLFVIKDKTDVPWEAVPLTKTFEIVNKAHILTDHGGVDAMTNWLSTPHYIVAEICLTTILEVCKDCPQKTSDDIRPEPVQDLENVDTNNMVFVAVKRKNIPKASGLLEILNMSELGTKEKLDHLVIYQDMSSKFLQLRPLTGTDLVESTVNELTLLFSDIGLPESVVFSSASKGLFTQALKSLNQIFNTEIMVLTADNLLVDERCTNISLKVKTAIKNWLNREAENKLCMGCFIVQWELNNVRGKDGKSPFEKVFGKSGNNDENSEDVLVLESIDDLKITSGIDDFITDNPVLEMPSEFE